MRPLTPREVEIVEEFRTALRAVMDHVLAKARLQRERERLAFLEEMRDEIRLTKSIMRGDLKEADDEIRRRGMDPDGE